MSNPKVYMVGGSYLGCWQVRCLLPMIHNGWSGNYLGLEKKLKPIKIVEQEMKNADIVVFHRANTNWHHRLGMILKAMGKKIVFDNDDTYKLDENHPFWGLDDKGFKENKEKINNVINNFILNSDLVTCSTEYLAEEYRKINKNVAVLPNCIDPDDWDSPPLRNNAETDNPHNPDKVRIGIVGSSCFFQDFSIIEDLLRKLDKDKRVQLVLLGLVKKTSENPKVNEVYKREFGFWETLENLEHTPWCEMVDYFRTLNELRLDMVLIPRRENHFNKAKSNIKFLEMAMCEIPCIMSSFKNAPYECVPEESGILVGNDEKAWETAVFSLINDKEKRREMGKQAHSYVLKNFQIKDHAHKWADTYNKLINK